MANLFKQKITRRIPANAEIFTRNGERFARWMDGNNKKHVAPVTGEGESARIKTESATWYARIRLANGALVDVATGCRDKSAAASRLAEIVSEQEKIRGGIISESEAKTAGHGRRLLTDTFAEYGKSLSDKQCSAKHVKEVVRYLERARAGLGWRMLSDMNGDRLAGWLTLEKLGARMQNHFIIVYKSFTVWAMRRGYLSKNPFIHLERRNEAADRKHIRRALTQDELTRLIEAARQRPEKEALKGNRGNGEAMKKKTAEISTDELNRLRFLGWTRAAAYWTAAATGLRWGELRSITLGAVRLDADTPHLILAAADEKARRGAQIPLPGDLAAELNNYVTARRKRILGDCSAFPGAMDTTPLFDVPAEMVKVFDRDCIAAKIPKKDSAGRVVDVHALRHTFGTMLAKAGVSLQVAQRAMRHSDPKLTANAYTHLELSDVAGAVNRIPSFAGATIDRQQTAEMGVNPVTPSVTPTTVKTVKSVAISGIPDTTMQTTTLLSKERELFNTGNGFHEGAMKNSGAPDAIRTHDLRLRRPQADSYNDLEINDIQTRENSVTPEVTPEIKMDVKKDLAAALRGLGKDELVAMLVEALKGE